MTKVTKSPEQWREQLTAEQYRVTREQGTERPFTSDYNTQNGQGIYHCVCCSAPLFENEHKFDAGCGWPSFDRPLGEHSVAEHSDTSHGMRRTEVVCPHCDAHLGHVFPDGPPDTTGQRYCINGVALDFHPDE
ncbi:MAG: peptide-methionine (R)-S-oxide reductase MsrB [Halomonas subglaciescola]|nr:peptide-methionine (R)-S-oxide reductase MsrB [Halomonas subglaciescola]